jgi:hypothetical protein
MITIELNPGLRATAIDDPRTISENHPEHGQVMKFRTPRECLVGNKA